MPIFGMGAPRAEQTFTRASGSLLLPLLKTVPRRSDSAITRLPLWLMHSFGRVQRLRASISTHLGLAAAKLGVLPQRIRQATELRLVTPNSMPCFGKERRLRTLISIRKASFQAKPSEPMVPSKWATLTLPPGSPTQCSGIPPQPGSWIFTFRSRKSAWVESIL